MARTYRRQYPRTIVRAPRKRWNISSDQYHSEQSVYSNNWLYTGTIAYNADDAAQPTPVILKCKNATVYGCLTVATETQQGAGPLFVMSYIVYFPQIVYASMGGLTGQGLWDFIIAILDDHPEWIMSSKNVNLQYDGNPTEKASVRWTQSSGVLKRNLKSGDRIMLIVTSRMLHLGSISAEFYAESKCNTCAN